MEPMEVDGASTPSRPPPAVRPNAPKRKVPPIIITREGMKSRARKKLELDPEEKMMEDEKSLKIQDALRKYVLTVEICPFSQPRLRRALKVFKKQLECVVCLINCEDSDEEKGDACMTQCENGHLVCLFCVRKMQPHKKECPLCRVKLVRPYQRNIAANSVREGAKLMTDLLKMMKNPTPAEKVMQVGGRIIRTLEARIVCNICHELCELSLFRCNEENPHT